VTGSSSGQLFEVTDGIWVVRGTGFDTCTSIDVIDGDLFITNSTPGTITRTDPTTFATTTVLAGLEYAWGVTSDGTDAIYFLEHGRGNIWQSTTAGAQPILLATATGYGVQFIAAEPRKSAKSRYPAVLYISDPQANVIWRLERGHLSIFASNFTGKSNMPYIGPTGLALAAAGALYVADAAKLWRITPTRHHRK
jgi:hypothetical protein